MRDPNANEYFIGEGGVVLREVIGPLEPGQMVAIVDELLES